MTDKIKKEVKEVEVKVDPEVKEKPKAKPKAKAKPKTPRKRTALTKADLEVKVKELTEQLDTATRKSEILFNENQNLKQQLSTNQELYMNAFRNFVSSVQTSLASFDLIINQRR